MQQQMQNDRSDRLGDMMFINCDPRGWSDIAKDRAQKQAQAAFVCGHFNSYFDRQDLSQEELHERLEVLGFIWGR